MEPLLVRATAFRSPTGPTRVAVPLILHFTSQYACVYVVSLAAAHNEDGEPWFADQMFLVVASHSPELKTSDYFALCYPGQLAGAVFGFNNHGLVFVATRVAVQETRHSGIATSFALRDLLAADSPDDAHSVFTSKEHVWNRILAFVKGSLHQSQS
jgi:hypothetical protein